MNINVFDLLSNEDKKDLGIDKTSKVTEVTRDAFISATKNCIRIHEKLRVKTYTSKEIKDDDVIYSIED